MPDALERQLSPAPRTQRLSWTPPGPTAPPAERSARRALLEQVERLEAELCSLFTSTWPRRGLEFSVPARGGPRLLSLYELEQLRDDLAHRVDDARHCLAERTYLEERNRCRVEEMLLEPERHKWVRIANEDIGEPGCKHWHVMPRFGLLGMLMNWWRVRISSGCPLPEGRRDSR